ncbi:MAG: hypothetical protein V1889_02535 [archaeon]
MNRGKLVVFEGTDCSGKSTQINLLIEKLWSMNRGVVTLDFPNYLTPTGKIVRRYLDGEFGPANDVDARLASIFYAEDRSASKGIVVNANTIPLDPSTPFKPSGIRLGTPILTTMGMKDGEMVVVGNWIADVIENYRDAELKKKIWEKVWELCGKFRFY